MRCKGGLFPQKKKRSMMKRPPGSIIDASKYVSSSKEPASSDSSSSSEYVPSHSDDSGSSGWNMTPLSEMGKKKAARRQKGKVSMDRDQGKESEDVRDEESRDIG